MLIKCQKIINKYFNMEDKKKILIIVISVLLLIILFAILFFGREDKKEIENNKQEENNNQEEILENTNANQIKEMGDNNMEKFLNKIQINDEELYTKQLAKIFTERFNTYSNQNDNVHIEEVKSLVTDSMYSWIETNKMKYSEDYEGVTSQVLSTKILEFDKEKSIVLLGVKQSIQKEINGMLEINEVINEVKVELIKENDEWFVDGFFWE